MITLFVNIFRTFNRNERLIFFGLSAVISVSAVILGLLIFQSATVEAPAASPRYIEGIVGQPVAVNPILAGINDADRDLIRLLFSDLIGLAKEYKSSNDNRTWNIVLKDNLRWSDGKPLTADDVVFTLDAIQSSESRSPLSVSWQGVVINRISEREVEFTLRTPYAFFADNLKELIVIPKHIWGAIPSANFRLSEFNLKPTGSGPYAFVSFEKRNDGFITAYHLATNPYFSGEAPFIKNFTIKFFQNPSELITSFNSRQIDGFSGLNPKDIPELKLGKTVLEKSMPRYYAIFLNRNIPGLDEKDVVLAINSAINRKEIIENVFAGKALEVNQPVLPILEGYDKENDPAVEFSPEKSAGILDKAGWKLNADNVREKKTGKQVNSLEFSLVVPQSQPLMETADIVRKNLSAIGIKLNLITLNAADISNEIIKTRNYQMILFGNILKQNPDLFSFWHSSERFYPGLNLSLYENKKVDGLLEQVRKESDPAKRAAALSQIQKMISEDMPAIFLYSPKYLYAAPSHFGGFEEPAISVPSDRFRNVNKWYLETTRVFQ